MGFQEPVEEILGHVKSTKQTLLFSATMPAWVESVARRHLQKPVTIDVVGGEQYTHSHTHTPPFALC
jgi:ATP-dependent RNA helicase DDX21